MMQYKTLLNHVLGLDFAQSCTRHWWMQRVTAVALIPLSFFAINLLDLMLHARYQDAVVWLSSLLNSSLIIAWLVCACYHIALGLQVVIEDYIPNEAVKTRAIWSVYLIFSLSSVAGVIAVLRIFFQ